MQLNNVVRNIELWQQTSGFLPITCAINPLHDPLVPKIENGNVCLFCPDCSYIRTSIPAIFSKDTFENKFNVQRSYFKPDNRQIK